MSSNKNDNNKDEIKLEFQTFEHSNQPSSLEPVNLDGGTELFAGMDVKKPDFMTLENSQQNSNTNSSLGNSNSYSFWSFEYYQQLFNVEGTDVLLRMLASILPFKPNFLSYIKENPDLWGPFWLSTTLIILLAVCSNFGGLFNWWGAFSSLGPNNATTGPNPFQPGTKPIEVWTNDFSIVTVGALIVYLYTFVLPTALWFFMKWKSVPVSFMQIISLYGYSLTIFIPCVLLMIVNYEVVRWVSVAVAFLVSSLFLLISVIWELKDKLIGLDKFLIVGICIYMFLLQAVFAFFVKVYFFSFW